MKFGHRIIVMAVSGVVALSLGIVPSVAFAVPAEQTLTSTHIVDSSAIHSHINDLHNKLDELRNQAQANREQIHQDIANKKHQVHSDIQNAHQNAEDTKHQICNDINTVKHNLQGDFDSAKQHHDQIHQDINESLDTAHKTHEQIQQDIAAAQKRHQDHENFKQQLHNNIQQALNSPKTNTQGTDTKDTTQTVSDITANSSNGSSRSTANTGLASAINDDSSRKAADSDATAQRQNALATTGVTISAISGIALLFAGVGYAFRRHVHVDELDSEE